MTWLDKAREVLTGGYLTPSQIARAREKTRHSPEAANLQATDEKLYYLPDMGAALTIGTLVHGPGASDVLAAQQGFGGDANSAVFACLMALSLGHIEAPYRVWQRPATGEGSPEWLADSELQALLDDPNPVHDDLEVWFWTTWAKHCDGNAYLRKVRAGDERTGNVIQLWPISPNLIEPWTDRGSRNFIDAYKFAYAPGRYEYIPPENIVHFRIGIDDRDHRKGLSPLKRLVREVAADVEATRFADALLRNFGIPGLVVTTPPGNTYTEEQARALKSRLQDDFGTDNRGNVGVLSPGADMKQFGFSPDQLNLHALHNVPETRICAAMGVHPAVAMLGVGLEQTANYASLNAVYEAFTERKLAPNWRLDAAKLNKQLKPDFTSDRGVYIENDLTDVRSLQEDRNALFQRLNEAVKTGWILPDEARSEIGLPPLGQVAPAEPAGRGPELREAAPDEEEEGKARRLYEAKAPDPDAITAEALQMLVDAAVPGFEAELAAYWDGQRKRVKRALVS